MRFTQKLSDNSGVSRCGTTGSPSAAAAPRILSSDPPTQAATTGFSTSVSVLMT